MTAEPRVVSLVPAATEMLRFLGVEPVGVSHCCEANGAPVLTRSIIPDGLNQTEIDAFVSEARADDSSLYRVDEDLLEALRPDLILTQGVCEVCAVAPHEVARASHAISSITPTLLLNGTRLDDLFTDLEQVASAVGVQRDTRIAKLRARLEAMREATAGRTRPRVAMIEWLEPPFLAGHWVPDLLEAAGAVSLGVPAGAPSPRVTWEEIRTLEPDVLLFSFCGYDLHATLRDLEGFALPVQIAKMWALDSRCFCALTPHVVRGVEILAGLLHDLEPPNPTEARAWQP
jgi:iron complex transport system substrate-binding protein